MVWLSKNTEDYDVASILGKLLQRKLFDCLYISI